MGRKRLFKTVSIDETHLKMLTECANVLSKSKAELLRSYIQYLHYMLTDSKSKLGLFLVYDLDLSEGQIIITIRGYDSKTFKGVWTGPSPDLEKEEQAPTIVIDLTKNKQNGEKIE